jgi:molybdopterin adenylyltransferase
MLNEEAWDMSYQEHQRDSAGTSVACAVVTLSDTRTPQTDSSGAAIQKLLSEAGHRVVCCEIVKDEPADFEKVLATLLARADVDAILTNGGTGISRRDQTIDVVTRRIEIPLPGFGELFRMLSWQQIGSGAMLSRAAGGICRGKLLFAMPGSTKAVELAMTKLILPELGHLMKELRK